MTETHAEVPRLSPEVCVRALEARDPRFDGVFFVGITSTRIYCRPICPARVSRADHRRFFASAATAERAGFRPCRRCRPELAPGRALVDAVSRLAGAAARRIAAGALNGRPVRALARELCVSERHLRRALERELGVSPLELAQTHRLLLAKQLLTDTDLSVGRIAYASGFGSLRRFNVVFRERYGLSPSALRRKPSRSGGRGDPAGGPAGYTAADGLVRLTLAYRPPLAWAVLLRCLARDALPGVELVHGSKYYRTVAVGGRAGIVIAEDTAEAAPRSKPAGVGQLDVCVSPSLLPSLMPLMAALRHLFDLDAEPAVIDACLERGGLPDSVASRRGLRMPGGLCAFEIGLAMLLRRVNGSADRLRRRLVEHLGEPIDTGIPGLERLAPEPGRIAATGVAALRTMGLPAALSESLVALARLATSEASPIAPGSDADVARASLAQLPGFDESLVACLLARAVGWPDAFAAADSALQSAAGVGSAAALEARAEAWRPWRAYAALHLQLDHAAELRRRG